MQILLVRHGDALIGGYDDASRPLSVMGVDQSRIVGNAIKTMDIHPEAILSSPLVRAKEMAAIIGEILQVTKIGATEFLVPGTDQRQLVAQINTLGIQSILLVGHEPHLHNFASYLTTESHDLQLHFGNGTLACIEVRMPVQAAAGTLTSFMTVEQLEMVG